LSSSPTSTGASDTDDNNLELNSMSLRLSTLERELSDSLHRYNVAVENNRKLHRQMIGGDKQNTLLTAQITELSAQIDALNVENENLLTEKTELEKWGKGESQDLEGMKTQVTNLLENTSYLREQLEKERDLYEANRLKQKSIQATLQNEKEELKSTLKKRDIEILEAIVERTELKDYVETLSGAKKKLTDHNNQIQFDLMTARQENDKLQKNYDEKLKASLMFKSMLDKAHKEREDSVIKLADHIQRNANKDNKVEEMTKQLTAMTKKLAFVENDLAIAKKHEEALEAQIRRSRHVKESADDTVNALQRAREEEGKGEALGILTMERDKMSDEKRQLRVDVDTLEEKIAVIEMELKEAQENLEKEKLAGLEKTVKIKSMEKIQGTMEEQKKEEALRSSQEIEKLGRELSSAKDEIEKLSNDDLEAEVEQLKISIKIVQEENVALNLQVAGLNQEMSVHTEEQHRMEQVVREKTVEVRNLQEEMSKLRSRLGGESRVTKLEREKFEWVAEKEKLEKELSKAREKGTREVDFAKKESKAWKNKVSSYERTMKAVMQLLEEFEGANIISEMSEEGKEREKIVGVAGMLMEKLKIEMRLVLLGE